MGKQWDKGNYCDIIPDVLFGVDLSKCCYNHDVDYWKKPISRKEADRRLKLCMQRTFNRAEKFKLARIIPNIIYGFLRIGGWIKW